MNADLEKLVRLHHVESSLSRVEADLAEAPRRRQELEERLARDRSRLDTARGGLDEATKARKQHEAAVLDLETKRSKYKGQLMDVKTNKEYTAMLHEIEGVERDIRGREDQVLEQMEKIEGFTKEIKHEEAAFKLVEQAARAEQDALAARETELASEATRLRGERDEVLAELPENARTLYTRVAKLRGTAVAEARDGICHTCNMKLRLQVWFELRRNEALIQCDSCSRILFYEPPPPTVTVEP